MRPYALRKCRCPYIDGVVLNVTSSDVDVVDEHLGVLAFLLGGLLEKLLEPRQGDVRTSEERGLHTT
jgi:hypothetical protein